MKHILLKVFLLLLLLLVISGLFVYRLLPKKIGSVPQLQTFLFSEPETLLPMEGKYIYQSAQDLAGMIKSGRATSVDIVTEHIAHIKNNNWKYNALVWLREKEAVEEAKKADQQVSRGDTGQPLLGVPVTIKEQFGITGLPMTLNAKRLGIIARKDAAVVEQIRRSGAIILGTTNLSLMVGFNETFGEVYPTGNNPYDTTRTPGGSSGGEAAALSAGFTALSLGGDAGGSVRIPAAFCGVYGFKPSFGSVNITDGVMPFEIMKGNKFGIAHAGIMARTAEDLALFWQILKHTPPDLRFQKPLQWTETGNRPIDDYKVAWIDKWHYGNKEAAVGSDVQIKLATLLDSLKAHGVSVKKDAPDMYQEMLKVWGGMLFLITTQDENWLMRKLTKVLLRKMDNGDAFFDEIKKSLDDNSDKRWNMLLKQQRNIVNEMDRFLSEYDVMVLPVTYGHAFTKCNACPFLSDDKGDSLHYIDYFPYTGIFNASGNPAVVLPMGLDAEKLPIGLQIVGRMYHDDELLHFVSLIEPLIAGFVRPGEQ
jgi:amidase